MFLFFSPRGEGEPCGMFTLPHIILLVVCLFLIGINVYLASKQKEEQIFRNIRVIAVTVVVLEIIKIGYNFYYGYTSLDNWLPLAFCSLFIYSTIMAGFFKNSVREIGISFLVGGGTLAGLAFLIFPTTSLMMHPIYHFLSIHSMFFHSLMVYVGIICYKHKLFKFNKQGYIRYCIFCLIFIIPALIVNNIFDCNMMFLKEPFNLPIPLLTTINQKIPFLYKTIIIFVYLVVPYGLMSLINKILNKWREKYA